MKVFFAKKENRYLFFLLGGLFVFYLSWAIIIPFGMAPDEVLRFDIVDFISKYHQLPVAGDPRLLYAPDSGVTYVAMPYFPYMLSGALCIFVKFIGLNLPMFIVSRLVSVVSGVVTIYFVYLIAAKLFKNSVAKYFLPIFVAFIPQFSFISSYTNQDSFMVMLSAILIYLWIKGIETNWNYKTVISVGIVLGLILLSYINGYVLIPATLLIVLLSHKKIASKEFVYKLLVCLGICLLVCGWFFIRNAYLYHGDFLGRNTTNSIAEIKAAAAFKPSLRLTVFSSHESLTHFFFNDGWLITSFKSFWAYLENMTVSLSSYYYMFIALITLISFMGLTYSLLSKSKISFKHIFSNKLTLTFVATAIGAFLLDLYYTMFCDYQAQGRYMYPGLIVIMILMIKGFENVFSGKAKNIFYKFVGIIVILVDLNAIYKILLSRYFFS